SGIAVDVTPGEPRSEPGEAVRQQGLDRVVVEVLLDVTRGDGVTAPEPGRFRARRLRIRGGDRRLVFTDRVDAVGGEIVELLHPAARPAHLQAVDPGAAAEPEVLEWLARAHVAARGRHEPDLLDPTSDHG